MNRESLIKVAIQSLEGNDFERFVYALLSRKLYPGLIPTSQSGDLGEDARTENSTLFLHNGKWISLAASKESGWGKIKKDCDRCKETERKIDILVFVTAGNPKNTTIEKWKLQVKETYGWELEVRTIKFLTSFANRPEYEDIVDQYLQVPPLGGDFIKDIEDQFEKETKRALRNISISIPGINSTILRDEIKRIEDQLRLGKSILLTGEAGSGKSGIARQLIQKITKPVLFLDARRLGHIKSDTELRNYFGFQGSMENAVIRLACYKGCLVIIDQMDNSIGLPISELLIDLAKDISNMNGVEVLLISRKREIHEIRFLERLSTQKGFVEINSNPLSIEIVRHVLLELGIDTPSEFLVQMGRNLLNLEVIGRLIQNNVAINVDEIISEIDLWEEYIEVIRQREGNHGDAIISEAIKLSARGIRTDEHTFTLDANKSLEQQRLESWQIIVCDYGRIYRFHHDKLQDYLYAFDASERGASKQDVINELGDSHRTRNIHLLIQEIYHRTDPSRVPKYLREAWNV